MYTAFIYYFCVYSAARVCCVKVSFRASSVSVFKACLRLVRSLDSFDILYANMK